MHLFEASSANKNLQSGCSRLRAVLGSHELDKLNSYQDNSDLSADYLSSGNVPQLEQNKAQANIRDAKWNKVASSPFSASPCGGTDTQPPTYGEPSQVISYQIITMN